MTHKVTVYFYRYEGKEWLSLNDIEYVKHPPTPKCNQCGNFMSVYYGGIYAGTLSPVFSKDIEIEIEDNESISKFSEMT